MRLLRVVGELILVPGVIAGHDLVHQYGVRAALLAQVVHREDVVVYLRDFLETVPDFRAAVQRLLGGHVTAGDVGGPVVRIALFRAQIILRDLLRGFDQGTEGILFVSIKKRKPDRIRAAGLPPIILR